MYLRIGLVLLNKIMKLFIFTLNKLYKSAYFIKVMYLKKTNE